MRAQDQNQQLTPKQAATSITSDYVRDLYIRTKLSIESSPGRQKAFNEAKKVKIDPSNASERRLNKARQKELIKALFPNDHELGLCAFAIAHNQDKLTASHDVKNDFIGNMILAKQGLSVNATQEQINAAKKHAQSIKNGIAENIKTGLQQAKNTEKA